MPSVIISLLICSKKIIRWAVFMALAPPPPSLPYIGDQPGFNGLLWSVWSKVDREPDNSPDWLLCGSDRTVIQSKIEILYWINADFWFWKKESIQLLKCVDKSFYKASLLIIWVKLLRWIEDRVYCDVYHSCVYYKCFFCFSLFSCIVPMNSFCF